MALQKKPEGIVISQVTKLVKDKANSTTEDQESSFMFGFRVVDDAGDSVTPDDFKQLIDPKFVTYNFTWSDEVNDYQK